MLIPLIGYFLASGTLAGLSNNLSVVVPIALCLGVHVAMFAVMGRSCHGSSSESQTTPSDQPVGFGSVETQTTRRE